MNSEDVLAITQRIEDLRFDFTEWRKGIFDLIDNSAFTHRSKNIGEISAALAKAQGEFKIAVKNKSNPFFKSKYADFEAVVDASRPALSKNGLSVVQPPVYTDKDGNHILITELTHSSNEWFRSTMRINPAKTDVQAMTSYITYLKRTAYASLVGVVTGDESDDDGEAAVASSERVERYEKPAPKYSAPKAPISSDQLEELEYELEGYPEIAEQVLEGFKIKTLAEMPKEAFIRSMSKIRVLKQEQPAKK